MRVWLKIVIKREYIGKDSATLQKKHNTLHANILYFQRLSDDSVI